MHELYELKDMLCKELEEYGKKGELNAGALDVVDKLAHTVKNLDRIIEKCEEDGYSGRYPMQDWSYAQRDSRGRYSRTRGYSRDDGMVAELKELMRDAPDERTRNEFQKFIQKIEQW